jgi:ABC-2 type transport system permease protein
MSEGQPSLESHVRSADQFMRDTFGWYVVAKKEFQDAIRSKGLWVLGAVFTALFVAPPLAYIFFDMSLGAGARQQDVGMQLLISVVYTNTATFFVPIIAMFVGYGAITKERETGSLKILLSLPHSRENVIVGKVFGRMAVVGVPLLIALVATAFFLLLTEFTFKPQLYATFGLYTMGLALVFVAIAVSISGAVSRGLYSLVGNFVVYLYFTFGWNAVANGIATVLRDYLGVSGALRWHITLFVKLLNPTQSYKTLTNSMLAEAEDTALSARYQMFSQDPAQMRTVCADTLNGNATNVTGLFNSTQVVCNPVSGSSVPIFYTDVAVFVFLVAWIGVAAVLSYRTFNLADL